MENEIESPDDPGAPTTPTYKDRSTLLVVFGVLQILQGLLCGLIFIGTVLFHVFLLTDELIEAMGGQQSVALFSNSIYLFAAVFLIWTGIGAARAQRWARALLLTVSSMGLAMGAVSFSVMCVFFPSMMRRMSEMEGQVPSEAVSIMIAIILGFMFVINILIPGVLVLFYRSPHVKATCDVRNPGHTWTDNCPLPVLALVLLNGFWGVWMLPMTIFMPAFPFFGTMLTGPPAILLMALIGLPPLVLSWGLYRLRIGAWWGSIAMALVWFIFWGVNMALTDFAEYYRALDYSEQQIEMVEQMGMSDMMSSPGMIVISLFTLTVYLGYLVYIRRFFPKSA